jgi:hypothetical protein
MVHAHAWFPQVQLDLPHLFQLLFAFRQILSLLVGNRLLVTTAAHEHPPLHPLN